MTPTELLLVTLIALVGTVLQGSIGFGLGVFAVPFFLLIEPALVPGPILATSVLLTIFMTHHERHAIQLADLKWAIAGRVLGIGAAMAVLARLPAERLSSLMGGLIILGVALTASGLHLRPNPASLISAGTLSGFMGTAASIGGPAIALLYQRESGARVRSTLAAYFLIGTTLSLIGLHFVDRFGMREVVLAGVLIPGSAVGYVLARRLAPILDRGYTRIAVLTVSGVMGAVVLLRQLL